MQRGLRCDHFGDGGCFWEDVKAEFLEIVMGVKRIFMIMGRWLLRWGKNALAHNYLRVNSRSCHVNSWRTTFCFSHGFFQFSPRSHDFYLKIKHCIVVDLLFFEILKSSHVARDFHIAFSMCK